MEAVFVLEKQVSSAEGIGILEDKLSNPQGVKCGPRKKLADISNLPQQPKQVNQTAKSNAVPLPNKEQIEKLQKENMALTEALAERDSIIELGATELQKLRTDLEKVQEKNLQLAQANNMMLAELNSGKDKIKVLQHELDCKNCLLKVRRFELEEKARTGACHFNASEARDETNKHDHPRASSEADQPCNTRRRRCQQRNQSLSSLSVESFLAEENVNKKRPCRRRQSARLRSEGAESGADPLHMGDSMYGALNKYVEPIEKNHPGPLNSSFEKENEEKNVAEAENQPHPRSLVGRPLRRAAEKVQSYKEVPLNVKMRREV